MLTKVKSAQRFLTPTSTARRDRLRLFASIARRAFGRTSGWMRQCHRLESPRRACGAGSSIRSLWQFDRLDMVEQRWDGRPAAVGMRGAAGPGVCQHRRRDDHGVTDHLKTGH
jgi:hypothetical protein